MDGTQWRITRDIRIIYDWIRAHEIHCRAFCHGGGGGSVPDGVLVEDNCFSKDSWTDAEGEHPFPDGIIRYPDISTLLEIQDNLEEYINQKIEEYFENSTEINNLIQNTINNWLEEHKDELISDTVIFEKIDKYLEVAEKKEKIINIVINDGADKLKELFEKWLKDGTFDDEFTKLIIKLLKTTEGKEGLVEVLQEIINHEKIVEKLKDIFKELIDSNDEIKEKLEKVIEEWFNENFPKATAEDMQAGTDDKKYLTVKVVYDWIMTTIKKDGDIDEDDPAENKWVDEKQIVDYVKSKITTKGPTDTAWSTDTDHAPSYKDVKDFVDKALEGFDPGEIDADSTANPYVAVLSTAEGSTDKTDVQGLIFTVDDATRTATFTGFSTTTTNYFEASGFILPRFVVVKTATTKTFYEVTKITCGAYTQNFHAPWFEGAIASTTGVNVGTGGNAGKPAITVDFGSPSSYGTTPYSIFDGSTLVVTPRWVPSASDNFTGCIIDIAAGRGVTEFDTAAWTASGLTYASLNSSGNLPAAVKVDRLNIALGDDFGVTNVYCVERVFGDNQTSNSVVVYY